MASDLRPMQQIVQLTLTNTDTEEGPWWFTSFFAEKSHKAIVSIASRATLGRELLLSGQAGRSA